MNEEQFQRLQAEVDHIVRAHEDRLAPGELGWRQEVWALGDSDAEPAVYRWVTDEVEHILSDSAPALITMCGTYACFAGNVAHRQGDRFVKMKDPDEYRATDRVTWLCLDTSGGVHEIGSRAADLLGLSEGEADELFDSEQDYESILETASDIAARHGFTLVVP